MCDCIEKINSKLAPMNGKLATSFRIAGSGLTECFMLETIRLDKSVRKMPPRVSASHCPFCGEKTVVPG